MNKGNLGIVKAAKGEERRAENVNLTTHTARPRVRKADTAKTATRITTRNAGRTK